MKEPREPEDGDTWVIRADDAAEVDGGGILIWAQWYDSGPLFDNCSADGDPALGITVDLNASDEAA
jgi:hypothetical protein